MKNPIFNHEEGRIRSFLRVLAQIALLFILIPSIHSVIDSTVHSLCAKDTAAAILGYDSSQFIVMLLSIVWSVLLCIWYLDKRPFSDLGVVKEKSACLDYGYGFVLALSLVGAMLFLELATNTARISSNNFSQLNDGRFILGILDGLISCLMIGFQEELLRFYQIKNLSEGMSGIKKLGQSGSIIAASLLASLFFGCLHMGNNGVTLQAVLLLFLDGLFLSLVYITTGRGWLAFGFHAGWDFAEGNIFGFPVSGYPETYSLIKVEQTGAAVLTGGSFGPDGGLVNFVMIGLGTIGIIAWIYWRYGSLKLKLDLCEWIKKR